MTVLICRQSDVAAHWQNIRADFRRILPENGAFYDIERLSEDRVQLRLGNGAAETTIRYDGQRVHLVPFLDVVSDQPQNYWLAWYESWKDPQSGQGKSRRQFHSSSITVYAGSPGSNKYQVLRAEWAGGEVVGNGKDQKVVFQGKGAAHPHWHLSGLETLGTAPLQLVDDVVADSDDELAMLARELGAEDELLGTIAFPSQSRLERIDPAWASIHLATSARWAQKEWTGQDGPHDMHATDPESCGEIRSWLISCVRYLQSELQTQIHRGRW
ncbi:hypothetical protein [Devosia sp.]|uniref:hypothetical protein n=1 Tax=Devosia sp. TaxID=1871048 RepID=UPI0027371C65|nr:hypothetical protein [Devosia sp.]MDP2779279.1 hypothetical protein [Devosia sp.]